jgi:hypothetical protein
MELYEVVLLKQQRPKVFAWSSFYFIARLLVLSLISVRHILNIFTTLFLDKLSFLGHIGRIKTNVKLIRNSEVFVVIKRFVKFLDFSIGIIVE